MSAGYFNLEQAADRMQVSEDTILRAIRGQKLRAKKTGPNGGGKYLIASADLDAWFDGLVDA